MIGLFSPVVQVSAQEVGAGPASTAAATATTTPAVTPPATGTPPAKGQTLNEDAFKNEVPSCKNLLRLDIGKCLINISYFLLYTIPSSLLGLTAIFFNSTIALALSSSLYTAPFINSGWIVVRDLSNIFFILVLLYVAIQTILGIGHDTKKVIVNVVVMALLINFSMFFTKVVIDSSNILALVFYNKINVNVGSTTRAYSSIWSPVRNAVAGGNVLGLGQAVVEKDLSGGIFSSFDPTKLMSPAFFEKAKQQTQRWSVGGLAVYTAGGAAFGGVGAAAGAAVYLAKGLFVSSSEVPDSLILTIIVVTGLILSFAAYTFFTAGLLFLARMIELWILIIFSPFAFMSWTLPKLSGVDGIGWESWIKRLLELSFMAPIFMFFLYLIFLFVQIPLLQNFAIGVSEQDTYQVMLLIVLQTLIILILLKKITKWAKDKSGELGSMVIGGAKLVAGLAVGGAALGGAAVLRGSIGSFVKGASTGDTAANRINENNARIAANRVRIADPHSTGLQRFQARIDNLKAGADIRKGNLEQRFGVARAQRAVGTILNADQHDVEHASHARHELDTAANNVAPGKKWEELNGEQRYQARRQMARDRVIRDNAPSSTAGRLIDPITGYAAGGFGTRGWDKLSTEERAAVDRSAGVGNDPDTGHAIHGGALEQNRTVADTLIVDARRKQDIVSNVIQSSVTGSYDIRNLANIIAKEQSTGFAKMAAGLTGAIAMGMRGGLKQVGISYGESQGKFFKDLGHTISESLKSAKINVDLSHVGEVKKEDSHGGGGSGHH